MTLYDFLFARLNDVSVTDGVAKLYPGKRDAAFNGPSVVYQLIHGRDEGETMLGPTGITRARVQVSCMDRNANVAIRLRAKVKDRLINHSSSAGGLVVHAIMDGGNKRDVLDEQGMWICSQDFTVLHDETES